MCNLEIEKKRFKIFYNVYISSRVRWVTLFDIPLSVFSPGITSSVKLGLVMSVCATTTSRLFPELNLSCFWPQMPSMSHLTSPHCQILYFFLQGLAKWVHLIIPTLSTLCHLDMLLKHSAYSVHWSRPHLSPFNLNHIQLLGPTCPHFLSFDLFCSDSIGHIMNKRR